MKVELKLDNKGVDIANVKISINSFDEIPVEEAVRLKEKVFATEVIFVSCSVTACQETLRTALAIGAERAILVQSDVELQPLAVAKLLKALVQNEQPSLVISGKQTTYDVCNQNEQMRLGALLTEPDLPVRQGASNSLAAQAKTVQTSGPRKPQTRAKLDHMRLNCKSLGSNVDSNSVPLIDRSRMKFFSFSASAGGSDASLLAALDESRISPNLSGGDSCFIFRSNSFLIEKRVWTN